MTQQGEGSVDEVKKDAGDAEVEDGLGWVDL